MARTTTPTDRALDTASLLDSSARLSRRDVMLASVGLGVLAVVPACNGGATSSGDAGPACPAPSVMIGGNHGHVLSVPSAHVDAGTMRTYDVGGGDHTHQVTLSASDFMRLRMRTEVIVMTTTVGAHDHTITVRCA